MCYECYAQNSLKNEAPIYVKQFPVPEAYRKQLNLQVQEWLKIGVVKPTNSLYNSPIFVVPKKTALFAMFLILESLMQTHTLTNIQ
jgi:hypothetical protein